MYMLIRHKVRDFSTWKQTYDAHLVKRVEAGLTEKYLLQGADDPHEVIILFEVRDAARAKAFTESRDLRERIEKAGVVDRPDVYFLNDRSAASSKTSGSFALKDEIEELKRIEEIYTAPPDREVGIEFVYTAPQAKEVYVAGNFNNWDPKSLPMKKNKRGQWKATIRLLPGKYEYKYFVDGSWVMDKKCAEVVDDNCVIEVAPKMAA